MITRKEKEIIQTLILQPHDSKLRVITICGRGVKGSGSNFKLTTYAKGLVRYYQQQYEAAHKKRMNMARFCHLMCRTFAKMEPWIFKTEGIDKHKFSYDVLYAIQSVKIVFNAYVPDVKIATQSDALIALIGWQMARIKEMNVDGIYDFKGFVDFYDDDGRSEPEIEDFSKVTKAQAKELMQIVRPPKPGENLIRLANPKKEPEVKQPEPEIVSPTLEDLFEEPVATKFNLRSDK